MPGCPQDYCSGMGRLINLVDLFHKGMPPVNGGVLDQTYSFLEFVREYDSEFEKAKNDG